MPDLSSANSVDVHVFREWLVDDGRCRVGDFDDLDDGAEPLDAIAGLGLTGEGDVERHILPPLCVVGFGERVQVSGQV